MSMILATLMWSAVPALGPVPDVQDPAAAATERIELKKDGGPGHGFDQSYEIREQGAADLERFIGGKQVVFVEPFDWLLLILLVVLVVVLIIAL